MKIILRVYKNEESMEQQPFSPEEAQGIVEVMTENYPHLVFEPYMELDDNCVIDISEVDTNTTYKSGDWQGIDNSLLSISRM